MTIEHIDAATLPKPSGFAHAVRADNTVYLAGQTALDSDGTIVSGGIVAQFRQCLSNLLAALAGAGGTAADLVSVTIYLTDISDYQAHGADIGRVWRELAGRDYPAMAGIGTTGLWQSDALIEIQGIAVLPAR